MTAATVARPDTHEMVVTHRIFRRESRLLPKLIGAVPPGDTARARVLGDHFRDYLLGLHNHHHGEDELLWPPLLARVDLEADLVLRMEEQHQKIAATLKTAETALPAWEAAAGEAERDALVAILVEHRAVLLEHLDEEEFSLLPVAEQHLTVQEWGAMGEHFMVNTPKPKLLLFLGMALEDADADERATLLGNLPRPARILWWTVGRPLFARHVRRIRG